MNTCTVDYEVIKLAQELVKIPSENPVGTEEVIGNFIFNWLKDLNVEVTKEEVEPGRFNIIARLYGEREQPNLVYIAHMDTVPANDGWNHDPFSGAIEDGKLYGRGSADMKGGLAAAMVAFKRIVMRKNKPRRDFLLIASIDEEGAEMKGALAAIEKGWVNEKSYVIAPEPSGLKVMPAHKGPVWYEITTKGKASHAGNPQVGVDAIHAMTEILTRLKKSVSELTYDDIYLGKPTITISRISGGVKTNVVPDQCKAEIDLRLIVPMTIAESKAIIQGAIDEGIKKVPGASAVFKMLTIERPPIKAADDSPLVAAVAECIKEVTKKEAEFSGLPAYTDASIIAAKTGGKHCISFGPGNLAQAHTIDEYVPVEHLTLAANILTEVALKLIF
ncbi:MAG: M20 family metallopeptidase [Clostridia bacterium]